MRTRVVSVLLVALAASGAARAASVSFCTEERVLTTNPTGFDFSLGADISLMSWFALRPLVLIPTAALDEAAYEVGFVFSTPSRFDLLFSIGVEKTDTGSGSDTDARYRAGFNYRVYDTPHSAVFVGTGASLVDTGQDVVDDFYFAFGWRGR